MWVGWVALLCPIAHRKFPMKLWLFQFPLVLLAFRPCMAVMEDVRKGDGHMVAQCANRGSAAQVQCHRCCSITLSFWYCLILCVVLMLLWCCHVTRQQHVEGTAIPLMFPSVNAMIWALFGAADAEAWFHLSAIGRAEKKVRD